jgi:UDP-N-acetylglucosamine 2-epimerase (non-hydrolysing)/GDP/UDP-N,N'-diacetylbacillosamine 2-epimerase (hydrolysing)
MGKRRIFIISERRADYARFKPILELLRKDPFFEYQLVVTGISLLKRHGEDINVIRQDGFEITAVVPMFEDEAPDTGAEMVRALARVCRGLTDEIERLKPDLILAGFDIGANFAAAVAGAHMNIPVAHIQGGEHRRVASPCDDQIRAHPFPGESGRGGPAHPHG